MWNASHYDNDAITGAFSTCFMCVETNNVDEFSRLIDERYLEFFTNLNFSQENDGLL